MRAFNDAATANPDDPTLDDRLQELFILYQRPAQGAHRDGPAPLTRNSQDFKALSAVRRNDISRARNYLTGSGLAPLTPANTDKLASLFPALPAGAGPAPATPAPQAPTLIPDDTVKLVLDSSTGSTSAGMSGLSIIDLRVIAETEEGLHEIGRTVNLLVSNRVRDPVARDRLLCGRGYAFASSPPKIRPVVVNEAFVALASRVLMRHLASNIAKAVPAHEHGVNVPSGVDVFAHSISAILSANPDFVMGELDFRAAFQHPFPSATMAAVRKHLPAASAYATQCIGTSTPIVFGEGDARLTLRRHRGFAQGDPFSPVLFSIVLRDAIEATAAAVPAATILSYFDDVKILGPLDAVVSAWEALLQHTTPLGLEVSLPKCSLYAPRTPTSRLHAAQAQLGLPTALSPAGYTASGAPFGSAEFVQHALGAHLLELQQLCNAVPRLLALAENNGMEALQQMTYFLRSSVATTKLHLARLVDPTTLAPFAARHDAAIMATVATLAQFQEAPGTPAYEAIQRRALLPAHLGGLGFPSLARISVPGYVAAIRATVPRLAGLPNLLVPGTRFVTNTAFPGVVEPEFALRLSLTAAQQPISSMNRSTWDSTRPPVPCLQRQLTEVVARRDADTIAASLTASHERDWFLSLQHGVSAAWLFANANFKPTAMNDDAFRFGLRNRVGAAIVVLRVQATPPCCKRCGQELDDAARHARACRFVGRTIRHDALNATHQQLETHAAQGQFDPSNEVGLRANHYAMRHPEATNEIRADYVTDNPPGSARGTHRLADITIVEPASGALQTAYNAKMTHYTTHTLHDPARILPLAYTTSGRPHEVALARLQLLARRDTASTMVRPARHRRGPGDPSIPARDRSSPYSVRLYQIKTLISTTIMRGNFLTTRAGLSTCYAGAIQTVHPSTPSAVFPNLPAAGPAPPAGVFVPNPPVAAPAVAPAGAAAVVG